MNLESAKSIVADWASQKEQIEQIRFFGSRVKGTEKVHSDIDIAVTIVSGLDECQGQTIWFRFEEMWADELRDLLSPWEVDLQWECSDETPVIANGLKEASYAVYERKN